MVDTFTWPSSRPPGAVDVIDTSSLTLIKTIPTKGGIHNTFVTPDGAYAVAGSIVGRLLTVIDIKTNEPVWSMPFDNGVRPIGFETNADGSTRRMFVQISDFHGFYVVDFADAARGAADHAAGAAEGEAELGHAAGVAVARHRRRAGRARRCGSCSKVNHAVYAYAMPDLKLLGGVEVGHHPDWLTFTPDSRRLYVANAGSNSVSVVDIATRKEIAQVPVGQVPKRNITARLP